MGGGGRRDKVSCSVTSLLWGDSASHYSEAKSNPFPRDALLSQMLKGKTKTLNFRASKNP